MQSQKCATERYTSSVNNYGFLAKKNVCRDLDGNPDKKQDRQEKRFTNDVIQNPATRN